MCLFCQIVPPQQTAAYKLTLDTNRPPPQLADLFQDMVAQAQAGHCLVASKELSLLQVFSQPQHSHVHQGGHQLQPMRCISWQYMPLVAID